MEEYFSQNLESAKRTTKIIGIERIIKTNCFPQTWVTSIIDASFVEIESEDE